MRRLLIVIVAMCIPVPCLLAIHLPKLRRPGHHHHVQYGMASWYGREFQRHRTASGSRFDRHKLTAAHRTIPLGTKVKVTNLRNGRSVVVKINDRGPWLRGRVIDLSEAAAKRLHFAQRGVVPVKITILKPSKGRHRVLASNRVRA